MPVEQWVDDAYQEYCDETMGDEDTNYYWYGDRIVDEIDSSKYRTEYDLDQQPPKPPIPKRVNPPSGTPPRRPPSAPYTPIVPPPARIRRPIPPRAPAPYN